MRKKKNLKFIEKICMSGILVLGIVIIFGVYRLYQIRTEKKDSSESRRIAEESETDAKEELTEPGDFLPQSLTYGKQLPVTVFETAEGEKADIQKEYQGETLILMYWGSWCSYCDQQLQHLEEFSGILEKRESVRLILINKTDPEKGENVEKALAYLEKNGITQECLFDIGLTAYQAYGMKRIPTTIVVDNNGYVRAMEADVIDSGEELEALLDYAESGGAAPLLDFLNKYMTNVNGGIYTNYLEQNSTAPSGHDVLSESMGLLMEYAVTAGNQELFDSAYSFVKNFLQRKGLFAWYVTEDGECARSNAFLDDLRIAGALFDANQQWGGYEEYLQLAHNILSKNAYKNQISSFYDFEQKLSGSDITLCYGDFQTLAKLSEADEELSEFSDRAKQLQTVIEQGYIGDEFPLYYTSWDYKKNKYQTSSLNTAEALLTLYHLAEADMLKEESLEWLRDRLVQDDLAARYEVDGSVPEGFDYDSTAVYAIAAMIGRESRDAEIYRLALKKMEQTRVTDTNSLFYGSFSTSNNGADITTFDQLMPLLVYADFGMITFE